jgi:hypothetical protein
MGRERKNGTFSIDEARRAWQKLHRQILAEPVDSEDDGASNFYHIEMRPKSDFILFRTQDVGQDGGVERVAGKRRNGSWDTHKWLISKQDAHVEDGRLIPDSEDAQKVWESLGTEPERVSADRFRSEPISDVPEDEMPTPAQQEARRRNIRKAQAVRRAA